MARFDGRRLSSDSGLLVLREVEKRLGVADCLAAWGRANIVDPGETRARYVKALRAADNHDIATRLLFARS